MAERSLLSLTTQMQGCMAKFNIHCDKAGLDVLIYCTYRSLAEQAKLYRQGRTWHVIRKRVKQLNDLKPGLGQIIVAVGPQHEKRTVTMAGPGQSAHNYRIAADGVPMVQGKPIWNADDPIWQTYGQCVRAAGLEWAGDWKGSFKEFPHMQMKNFTWKTRIKKISKADIEQAIADAEQQAKAHG